MKVYIRLRLPAFCNINADSYLGFYVLITKGFSSINLFLSCLTNFSSIIRRQGVHSFLVFYVLYYNDVWRIQRVFRLSERFFTPSVSRAHIHTLISMGPITTGFHSLNLVFDWLLRVQIIKLKYKYI